LILGNGTTVTLNPSNTTIFDIEDYGVRSQIESTNKNIGLGVIAISFSVFAIVIPKPVSGSKTLEETLKPMHACVHGT
jgi:hypothetical protein